jgi:predicted HicB family RNase H-like nuclease
MSIDINEKQIESIEEPIFKAKGKDSVMITIRLLKETREFLKQKANQYNLSLNEYIKQRLGIVTVHVIEQDPPNKLVSYIEQIFEI